MRVDVTFKSIQGDVVATTAADCTQTVANVLKNTSPEEHFGDVLDRCTLYHNVRLLYMH